MAPFAGARECCLVVVPSIAILNGLKIALGVALAEADEHALPTLRARGLLSPGELLPRVMVLRDANRNEAMDRILESQIVLTTAQTLRNRIPMMVAWMQQHHLPLFDLMITDEPDHYPAATWVKLATKLRDAALAHILNELLPIPIDPNRSQSNSHQYLCNYAHRG